MVRLLTNIGFLLYSQRVHDKLHANPAWDFLLSHGYMPNRIILGHFYGSCPWEPCSKAHRTRIINGNQETGTCEDRHQRVETKW